MSVVSPALSQSTVQGQPSSVGDLASPAPGTLQPGKSAVNITSGSSTSNGHGKLGNLYTPPAIIRNLTSQVKKQVNDARLNLEKKLAEKKINLVINQLELYKKWISFSRLSDDEKSGIDAIVDTNIAWYRQQDEAIQDASDLNAVQALVAQVDQQTQSLKVNMKKDAGIMACDQLDARIATARNVSVTVAGKIAALKARGNDTAQPEQRLADYNAHLDAASLYSDAARIAFTGITTADNADSGFNEGYRQIGLADREMSKAYDDLKLVYRWYLQNSRPK